MNQACREARDQLAVGARGPEHDPGVVERVVEHLAHCPACRTVAGEQARLTAALRGVDEPPDELRRARWLAQLGPSLDALAVQLARPAPPARLPWARPALALAASAAVVAGVWWSTRPGAPTVATLHAPPLLQPYLVAGLTHDDTATTLLAGRFATLDVAAGVLTRVVIADDPGTRLAVLGPSHLELGEVTADTLELRVDGTAVVDAGGRRSLWLRGAGVELRARRARFAAALTAQATVFVDDGAVTVDGAALAAGRWQGPADARSPQLVAALREQVHAATDLSGATGVLAVRAGGGAVSTEGGLTLGPAPLWARLPVGPHVVVLGGDDHSTRASVVIDARALAVVDAPPALADDPTATTAATTASTTAAATTATPETTAVPAPGAPARPGQPSARPHRLADDAAALYARAEAALDAGDRDGAAALLRSLVESFPSDRLAWSAMYDLAGLARRAGDRAAAAAWLERLLAGDAPAALREPAHYLRCRLAADGGDPDATRACFSALLARGPGSVHDDEALAWLIADALARGDCDTARRHADSYLARHPDGAFAARARAAATCGGSP